MGSELIPKQSNIFLSKLWGSLQSFSLIFIVMIAVPVFFVQKRGGGFFKAAEKTFQSLQKSVKKIHIRIFTAGIDKLWRIVYTLGANTKFYNQVKAKGSSLLWLG